MNKSRGLLVVVGLGGVCLLLLLVAACAFLFRAGSLRGQYATPQAGERVIAQTEGYIVSMVFAPDWSTVATGTTYQGAQVWRVSDGKQLYALPAGAARAVAFSPDGSLLAVAWSSADEKQQQVELRRAADGSLLRTLVGQNVRVESLAFSPDGFLIAVGTFADTRICQVATGECRSTLDAPGWNLAFSPDAQTLVTAGDHVSLWQLQGPVHLLDLPGWNLARFSPDGKTLAVVPSPSGVAVQLLDAQSLQQAGSLAHASSVQPPPQVHSLAFSPGGKLLAAGSNSGTATIWDLASGKETRTVEFNASLDSGEVAFSPDGKTLATQNAYGITLWRLDNE